MKLNLGCGQYPLEGYTNIDFDPEAKADITADFSTLTFEDVEAVEMSHILEHISWQQTEGVLRLIRSWMREGGSIRIEVPNMEYILERAIFDIGAEIAIYGIQSAEGEFHLAGFTRSKLMRQLRENGFEVTGWRQFESTHEMRQGFPCLEVTAVAV